MQPRPLGWVETRRTGVRMANALLGVVVQTEAMLADAVDLAGRDPAPGDNPEP